MPAPVREIVIPYKPRPQQKQVHALTARFIVLLTHRRFGKTVLGCNRLQKKALTVTLPRPRCGYIGPTYRQAKQIAWDYAQFYARPIPGIGIHQSELRVDYPNAGQLRLYGSDNPDSLRGIYLDDAVLDEFGLHPPKTFTEVIMPTLVDRGGTALITGTPNGKNQFYDIAEHAKSEQAKGNPNWAYLEFKASETGLLDPGYLASARSVMTEDEYAQEFECSFTAAVKGAIFAKEMQQARDQGRVARIPLEPTLPVDTDWDLGVGDATAMWFSQTLKTGEVRLVDYYEAQGEGFPHYAQLLQSKGYTYGQHWAPHDIQVRELASGRSRLETAASLGIKFQIAPNVGLEDGIHAARLFLGKCWFDQDKCKAGLEALGHYRRDYNSRINEFKATPVHDWASHGADAFRYLAVRHKQPAPPRKTMVVRRGGGSGDAGGWMR